jgi:hypothetical protein
MSEEGCISNHNLKLTSIFENTVTVVIIVSVDLFLGSARFSFIVFNALAK